MTFFNLAEDELKNGTINPDERDHQERKARAQEYITHKCPPKRKKASTCSISTTRKRSGTVTCMDAINSDKDYCMRLRDAAGKDMDDRNAFIEAVHDILNEMKPPHVFANSVATRLWRRGEWKHYIFEAPRNPLELTEDQQAMWHGLDITKAKPNRHDDKVDALKYAYNMGPLRAGKSMAEWYAAHVQNWPLLHKQAESRAFRGKTADYLIMDDIFDKKQAESRSYRLDTGTRIHKEIEKQNTDVYTWAANELNKAQSRLLENITFPTHGVDFGVLEARVLKETGCTPEMLVNKCKFGPLSGVQTGRWGAGCYAKSLKYDPNWYDKYKDYFTSNPNPRPKEEFSMKIENQVLVNGRELSTLSNQELITMIRQTEDEIRGLEQLTTKSEHITNSIETHKKSCAQLAGFLDLRT
jgi:hypothetical protein